MTPGPERLPGSEGRALLVSLVVVVCAGAATIALLGPPFYHFNDDAVMSTIVSGVGWIGGETHPSERATFIHLFLGRALAALYRWDPTMPWYGLLLVSAVAIAPVELCFAALRLRPRALPASAAIAYAAIVTFSGLALLHFGIAASLLAGGGMALALSLVAQPARTATRTWLLGGLAFGSALLGAMLRLENAWLALAALAPLGAMLLLRRGWRAGRPLLAGLLGLALLHAALVWHERRDYAADPAWAETFDWMTAKRALVDYRALVRGERGRAGLAAAGWSPNDFDQLRAWFVWDPERYGAPSLRRVLGILEDRGAVVHVSLGRGRLRRALLTPWSVAALAIALLAGLAGSRREGVELALGVLWCVALLLGVALVLRAPPERVHVPVWLLVAGAPILWAAIRGGDRLVGRARIAASAALAALVLAGLVQGIQARSLAREREERGAAARRDLARLAPYRGSLLLNWAGLFPVHDLLRPLEPFADRAGGLRDYGTHSFFWLGWPTRLPINRLWLERHGVSDLYEALYRRDDLLLLTRPEYLPYLERDLLEHRRVRVGHELVLAGETVSVYRMVESPAGR